LEKDSSEFDSRLISNCSVGGSHDGRGDATSGTLPTPKPKAKIRSSKQSFSFISPPSNILPDFRFFL
jgi:hypothetical protein